MASGRCTSAPAATTATTTARAGRPPEAGGLSNSFVMQLVRATCPMAPCSTRPPCPIIRAKARYRRTGRCAMASTPTARHGHCVNRITRWITCSTARCPPRRYCDHALHRDLRCRPARSCPRAGTARYPRTAATCGAWRSANGSLRLGRGDVRDIADQTGRAFAREMGLTSSLRGQDDCSATQVACRASPQGGNPEVSEEFLQAVLAFQRELPVPARATLPRRDRNCGPTSVRTDRLQRMPCRAAAGNHRWHAGAHRCVSRTCSYTTLAMRSPITAPTAASWQPLAHATAVGHGTGTAVRRYRAAARWPRRQHRAGHPLARRPGEGCTARGSSSSLLPNARCCCSGSLRSRS